MSTARAAGDVTGVLRHLLRAKAGAHVPDISGRTALHVAASIPGLASLTQAVLSLARDRVERGKRSGRSKGPVRAGSTVQPFGADREELAQCAEQVVDTWCEEAAQFAAMVRKAGASTSIRDATGHDPLDWVRVGLRVCGDRIRALELALMVSEKPPGSSEQGSSHVKAESETAAELVRISLAAVGEDEKSAASHADQMGQSGDRPDQRYLDEDGDDDDDIIDLESDSDGSSDAGDGDGEGSGSDSGKMQGDSGHEVSGAGQDADL